MKDVGFITSGDGAHLQCYLDYRAWLDGEIYLRTLDAVDLADYRAIVIPDFSNQDLLRRHARQISDYLGNGGFLIVFEPNRMDEWLDAIEVQWFSRETEDWKWWMKPGGRMEAYQPQPLHPMARAIPLKDMCWHFFGAFRLRRGATPILNLDNDEGCLMYDQRVGERAADRFHDRSAHPSRTPLHAGDDAFPQRILSLAQGGGADPWAR